MSRALKSKAAIDLSHPSSSYRRFKIYGYATVPSEFRDSKDKISGAATGRCAYVFGDSKDKISGAATVRSAYGFGDSKDRSACGFGAYATQSQNTSRFRNFIEKSLHHIRDYFGKRPRRMNLMNPCGRPINCLGDYRVPGISQFAVDEINKRENVALVLEDVVIARVSSISGKTYYITLEATDSGDIYTYNVTVFQTIKGDKKLSKYTLESSSPLEQEAVMSVGYGFGGSKDAARTTYIKKKKDASRIVMNPIKFQSRMYSTRSHNTSPFCDFIEKSRHRINDYLQKLLQGINRMEHPDGLTNWNGDYRLPTLPYQEKFVSFLGQFAVDEINKREKAAIMLERVVTAAVTGVYGMVYRITLGVTDSGNRNIYNAIVYETYNGDKELFKFKLESCAPLQQDLLFLGNDTYNASTMLGNSIELRLVNCDGYKVPRLSQFAVDQFNKRENAALVLDRVVTATLRLVFGEVYQITLEATDSSNRNTYDVIAYVDFDGNQKFLEFTLESSSPLEQECCSGA